MTIDFRNTNTIWASILVETLYRLGLKTAIVCPGSRSTPLTLAFAQHPQIEAIPVLDERSAAFFALGLARRQHQPIALVCTSGTAGANFYPAVIEARESQVPLLVLTADRPPELRHCNAGQTIDQQKLYGDFPNWYTELATPALDLSLLASLRQTLIHAWEQALWPTPGPVHLNLPLRDPLAPLPEPAAIALATEPVLAHFFDAIHAVHLPQPQSSLHQMWPTWRSCDRGVIIVGPTQPQLPAAYCDAVARLSQALGWPVLAEGLSPLRNYASLNPYLVTTYDLILRQQDTAAALAPQQVIRLGETPTSKTLRSWLETAQPQQWIIDASARNLDPLHLRTTHLRLTADHLATQIPAEIGIQTSYSKEWCDLEQATRQAIDRQMSQTADLVECKAAWLLSHHLPAATPLFIANSMPVRDVEAFWSPSNSQIQPYFNRGANGIDGTIATALGIAHRQQSSVLLTGDLALLHDTNGFLLRQSFVGHLTIILINNNGGGIFEMLPIAKFDPPFEAFFATPQNINFAHLCQTYGVSHEVILSWQQLIDRLNPLPNRGIRILEIPTDRKADSQWRRHIGQQIQQAHQ